MRPTIPVEKLQCFVSDAFLPGFISTNVTSSVFDKVSAGFSSKGVASWKFALDPTTNAKTCVPATQAGDPQR